MNLIKIVQKRKPPGIILFNKQGDVVFFNEKTLEIFSDLNNLPPIIFELQKEVRDHPDSGDKFALLNMNQNKIFSLRALTLKAENSHDSDSYIMILIENIAEKSLDFKKIQVKYKLTKRQMEVLMLICEGFTNKEISDKLFISEYTVKDHIKDIMKKLKVNSRNEIIALLMKSNQR